MRTWADSTLMSMKKSDLIECLRCAEHNKAVAEERLAQHIENVKEWVPVVHCKGCKYGDYDSKPNGAMVCLRTNDGFWRKETDFCSYGEYQTNTGGSNNVAD
nr:MAG TPA: Sgf11 (transcriptional regulation protein) [Caudoviricetes sp.]